MSARQPDPTLIDELPFTEVAPTLRIMGDAGISDEDARWMRTAGNGAQLRHWIRQMRGADGFAPSVTNPFAISVTETIRRLQEMSDKWRWDLPKRSVARLFATAPAWPEGSLAFRSLRLRFGADDPVEFTARLHLAACMKTHGSLGRTAALIQSAVLSAGPYAVPNRGYCLEWVRFTLSQRDAPTDSPARLADEMLTFSWLFPEYVQQIDRRHRPALLLPGYQLRSDGVTCIPFIDKQDDAVVVGLRPVTMGMTGGFVYPHLLP